MPDLATFLKTIPIGSAHQHGIDVLHLAAGVLDSASFQWMALSGASAVQWAANVSALGSIGAWVRQNDVAVTVEASFQNGDVSWWGGALKAAGIQVAGVEDDGEQLYGVATSTGITVPGIDVANVPAVQAALGKLAGQMQADVAEVSQLFPSAKIGYWIGPEEALWQDTMTSLIQSWIQTFDATAARNGLPPIGYIVSDDNWSADPTATDWQPALEQLTLALSKSGLNVALIQSVTNLTVGPLDQRSAAVVNARAAQLGADPAIGVPASTLSTRRRGQGSQAGGHPTRLWLRPT